MQFDDRLATVLRQSARGEAIDRIQYRQLLDLLGTSPAEAHGEPVDAAYRRLSELSAAIPRDARRRILATPGLRLRNTRLVAELTGGDPGIAESVVAAADLDEDQWLDLVPALSPQARAAVRRRRPTAPRLNAVLERLGVAERALPAAASSVVVESASATVAERPVETANAGVMVQAAQVIPLAPRQAPDRPPTQADGISAIVRRIEAFRQLRDVGRAAHAPEDPRLPLDDLPADVSSGPLDAFAFATDSAGRIVTADPQASPSVVGLNPFARDTVIVTAARPGLSQAFRRRLPLRDEAISIIGAPAIAGAWQLDATPRFEYDSGRFIGYLGRFRRSLGHDESAHNHAASRARESDRMRQILHELRTPVNAIQGFAEATQQGLFGAIAHDYRALAAAIAADSARILAAFEELDRLVRLVDGSMPLHSGESDLTELVNEAVRRLEVHTSARGSDFMLSGNAVPLAIPINENDLERLVWRLLATLAGAAAPGERLTLELSHDHMAATLQMTLPAVLARIDGESLFAASAAKPSQALTAGMFGSGFALRLAREEAKAVGGSLVRGDETLLLSLPLLTATAAPHSQLSETAIQSA